MSSASPHYEFEKNPVDCPVCNAPPRSQRPLFSKQDASFVRCTCCSFEFISPRPSAKWLAARYEFYGDNWFTDIAKVESDFAPGRYDTELRLLGAARGQLLLDVGCATGSFVEAAGSRGFVARGVDISTGPTRYGKDIRGLDLDCGDLCEMRYPDNHFDVVTLWATLEHLIDPNRFLSEAFRILRPGGRLGISVPNHASLSQRLLGIRNRYVGIDHVNYFTRSTLNRILARNGFDAVAELTDKINPVVILQDLRGRTSDGATVVQQFTDQETTDGLKYSSSAKARMLRLAHTIVRRGLRATGKGDLLYSISQKNGASKV